MPIADNERELSGAGALRGRHYLCGIERAEIQRSVRADRQQCRAAKTTHDANQLASDVELRPFHFALHSIAVTSNKIPTERHFAKSRSIDSQNCHPTNALPA